MTRVGRGQARSLFEELEVEAGRRRGGEIMDRYLTGSGGRDTGAQGLGAGAAGNRAPIPASRPTGVGSSGTARFNYDSYPSRGAYDPALVRAQGENARQQGEADRWAREDTAGPGWLDQLKTMIMGTEGSPKPVTLSGTPQVTIANPPPRPNVSVTITVNEATDGAKVADQIGKAIRSEMDGLQVSTHDSGL